MTMPAFAVTKVQTVIMMSMMVIVTNIDHFLFDDSLLFDDRLPGALGRDGCARGATDGTPDDGPVAAANGGTHGSAGAAAERSAEDGTSVDAAGKSGRREGGQSDECECLLACHIGPFM